MSFAASDVFLGIGTQQFTLVETHPATQQRLVNEDGTLLSAHFGLIWPQDKLRLRLEGQQSYGEIDYDGHTQSGIPHQTDTTHTITQGQASLGYLIHPTLEWYVGGNLQQTIRDVANKDNIAGATETYTELFAKSGLRLSTPSQNPHQVSIWLEWLMPAYARSDVDSRVTEDFSLRLKKAKARAYGMAYHVRLSNELSWFVEGAYLKHSYQDSTRATVINYGNGFAETYYQPPISFSHTQVYTGLVWHIPH
ncbi:hypothetical protein C8N29_10226 [Agitococcus lubricus]|uniref:Uncharacterized protein n=2 Tax=Agitococcus lubricus TaxID=1077255 RepID=A0A2T5J2B0_9GAMM|nr:hypothetical protein C8N29_10226 [Agitococcus lubricus]